MSEAELHILRARLDGGIRNKAARGEFRRGLPVGLVWGERAGEIRFHPDAAVTSAIRTVFERFAELGSVRRGWLWFRAEKLTFPLRLNYGAIRCERLPELLYRLATGKCIEHHDSAYATSEPGNPV